MPVKITPSYLEAARRFHDNHPDAEAATHRAFLGGLGLSEDAQRVIVNRNAPELAHHPQLGAIGAMPKSEHAKAVARLHEGESAGPENDETDNERTDRYIASRPQLGKRERRTRLVR